LCRVWAVTFVISDTLIIRVTGLLTAFLLLAEIACKRLVVNV